MKIHGSLVLLGLTLLFSTYANAVQTSSSEASQVRVLLSFDNSGHHVRKVVFTADTLSTPAIEKRDILAADLELPSLEDRLESGMATIIWSNNRMETIAVTTEPDPRLSHSPAQRFQADKTRLSKPAGAWLVDGPASASNLTILLPASFRFRLGFEQWAISLERYQK